jgi:putative salt-induced outer membrane protein
VIPAFNSSQFVFLRSRSYHFCKTRFSSLLTARLLAAAVICLFATTALADTVVLKNGDHLTGSVTLLTGGKLTVHTDYAGDIVIAFDSVSSVKVDKPIVLSQESKKGKKVDIRKTEITSIERGDKGFTVTTPSGTVEVAAADLTTARTPAAQKSYEDSLHPGWLHAWTGVANISFAVARGNSDTTTIGTGVTLTRVTKTDKTALYFNQVYTHDGLLDETTANLTTGGVRYDHNLNQKLFAFGTGDFTSNALQDLNLRTVAGGGFGWHAIAKPNRQFDILGGIVWTHESYSAVNSVTPPTPAETNSFAALDLGQQFTEKFGKNTIFTEQAYIFPDLQDTSQYRFTLNSTLSTKIKSFLSWQTSVGNIYVTNPPAGTKDNDFILTTGLGITFNKK